MTCVVGSRSISELLLNVSSDYIAWPVTGQCCCSTSVSNDTAAWKEIVPKLKKQAYIYVLWSDRSECMCRKCFLADRAIHVPEPQRKGCSKRTKRSW